MHQKMYANEILKKFCMSECNSAPIPIMVNLKLTEEIEEEKVDAVKSLDLSGICLICLIAGQTSAME